MPGYTANALFRFQNGTLQLAVQEGVFLVEGQIHFVLEVTGPVFWQYTSDVLRGHHLKIMSKYPKKYSN